MNSNKIKKYILSLMLILSFLLPTTIFASNFIVEETINGSNISIDVKTEAYQGVSIVIKNGETKYFIDQGRANDAGNIKFNTKLDDGRYELIVKSNNYKENKVISIKKDDDSGEINPGIKNKASLYVKGYNGVILDVSEEIRSGESVLDFTERVLRKNNIDYINKNGYLSSIDGQSEFDKGKDSGWMFKINGSFPTKGAGNISIGKEDQVSWLYTYDLGKDVGNNSFTKESNSKLESYIDKAINKRLVVEDIKEISKELIKKNKQEDIELVFDVLKNIDINNKELLENSLELNNEIIDLLYKNEYKNKLELTRKNLNLYFINLGNMNKYKHFNNIVDKSIKIEKEYAEGILSINNSNSNNIKLNSQIFDKLKVNDISRLNMELKNIDIFYDLRTVEENGNLVFEYIETSKTINIRDENNKVISEFNKPLKLKLKFNGLKNNNFTAMNNKSSIGGLYDSKSEKLALLLNGSGKIEIDYNNYKFLDVNESNWAIESIEIMANKEIVKGKKEKEFDPSGNITRAEFATLISRMLNLTKQGANSFTDVPDEIWYKEDVLKVMEQGYISGKSKEKFDGNSNITREEIAKIVGKIAEEYIDVDKNVDSIKYLDNNKISKWALDGVNIASEIGIIKGDNGEFRPKDEGTRAEAVTMLFRLYEIILLS